MNFKKAGILAALAASWALVALPASGAEVGLAKSRVDLTPSATQSGSANASTISIQGSGATGKLARKEPAPAPTVQSPGEANASISPLCYSRMLTAITGVSCPWLH
jgi:hypothetical protein